MSVSWNKQPKRWLSCKPEFARFAGFVVSQVNEVVGFADATRPIAAFGSDYKTTLTANHL